MLHFRESATFQGGHARHNQVPTSTGVPGPPHPRSPQTDEDRAMLKRLNLENFKVWRQLRLPLGRVTGLFGGNSTGKSSILQFLLMLKQTKNARIPKWYCTLATVAEAISWSWVAFKTSCTATTAPVLSRGRLNGRTIG